MTTRTWVGSSSNNASDPTAWTPNGAPAAGDTLDMNSGTMNVSGTDLAGDIVDLEGNGSSAMFNLSGATSNFSVALQGYGQTAQIDLLNLTDWVGGFSTDPQGNVTVSGPGARWTNTATSINGSAKINTTVDGNGTIHVDEAHSSGVVEFMAGVGSGQTVSISGYATYGGEHGVVQVDQPAVYQAYTDLRFGELHLKGLQADSYQQNGDTLTLYEQGNVVDTLKLGLTTVNDAVPQNFGVSQTTDGVVIHADGTYYTGGGTALRVYAAPPSPTPPTPVPAPTPPPNPTPTPTPPPSPQPPAPRRLSRQPRQTRPW